MLTALLGIALISQDAPKVVPPERPYVWTPKAGPEPQLTSPAIFGLRPLHPVALMVTATGKRPMKFSAENLPPGVKLDPITGVLSGSVGFPGNFRARITAKNSSGSDTGELRFVVGEALCLTPPMSVLSAPAPAIHTRLINAGWSEVHFSAPVLRDAITAIKSANLRVAVVASKFTGDDVKSLAALGVDSLLYPAMLNLQEAILNGDYLRESGRDISLHAQLTNTFDSASLMKSRVHSWRTGQTDDSWASVSGAGFSQDPWSPLAAPGSWNDPGFLYIGGNLTPSEQYSHMTLWCLLAAPLRLNTDPAKLDDFALSLLTNREVLEVNQDPLGKQARLTFAAGDFEVWSKLMEDQTVAIGVFNKGETQAKATLDFGDPTVKSVAVRDLWKQEKVRMKSNILPLEIRRHGAVLFRTNKNVDFRFRLGHDPKKPKGGGG